MRDTQDLQREEPRNGFPLACVRRLSRHGNGVRISYARTAGALPMRVRRADEGMKERVRHERLRFKFRMELASEKPRMLRRLDNFHVLAVGRASGDAETGIGQRLFVFAVEFIAVAMAFADFGRAIRTERRRI